MSRYTFLTAIGHVTVAAAGGAIVEVMFGAGGDDVPNDPLLVAAAQELTDYFAGHRRNFSLPLKPVGTEFQQAVWRALQTIPYGQTRSYAQIAAQIGRPRAVRAVGGACHRNPIAILIPCHRVVGANGSLTGYAGGVEVKKRLLTIEKNS